MSEINYNLSDIVSSAGKYIVGVELKAATSYILPSAQSIDYIIKGKLPAPILTPVSLDVLKVTSSSSAAKKCRVYVDGIYADYSAELTNNEVLLDLNKLTLPEEYTIGVDLIAESDIVEDSDITTITHLQIILAPTATPDTPVVTTNSNTHGWIITDTSNYKNLSREYILEDTNGNELASHPSVWGGVKEA